ncbi:MAG: hypothetical protein QOI66_3710, partial [Myxococcales bacterium]|nr:hypothetical protein [Myxococcales bacterium]
TGYFLGLSQNTWVNIAITIAAIVVCAVTDGGCTIFFTALAAAYNTEAAVAEGASFWQIVASNAITIAAGSIGGAAASGLAKPAGNFGAQLVGGAISAAVSAQLNGMARGGDLTVGPGDILKAAASGAASAAASYALAATIEVSMASGSGSSGSAGAGAARVESRLNGAKEFLDGGGFKLQPPSLLQPPPGGNEIHDNGLASLTDLIEVFTNASKACAGGQCTDFSYAVTTAVVTAGVQAEVSIIVPKNLGGGSGTFGLNLQFGTSDSSPWFVFTPGPTKADGFLIGWDVSMNMAVGHGSWTGLFDNCSMGVGPWSLSAFQSPGASFVGTGYMGLGLGLGSGFIGGPPVNFACYQTNYFTLPGLTQSP